jgi:hypothetical protein
MLMKMPLQGHLVRQNGHVVDYNILCRYLPSPPHFSFVLRLLLDIDPNKLPFSQCLGKAPKESPVLYGGTMAFCTVISLHSFTI